MVRAKAIHSFYELPEKAEKAAAEKNAALGKFLYAARRYKAKDGLTKTKDWIGASSLYFICPRQFVISYFFPGDKDSWPFSNALKAQVGTDLHHFLQNRVLGPEKLLWGHWLHTGSGHQKTGLMPTETPTETLEGFPGPAWGEWIYQEPSFADNAYRVRGKADGIIPVLGDPTDWPLLEIKTTSSENYKRWVDADSIPVYYKTQAEFYQTLCGRKTTWFWVFNTDSFASKIIEYTNTGVHWEAAKEKVCGIWTNIQNRTLPSRPCFTKNDPQAKSCPVADKCFDLSFLLEKSTVQVSEEILNWKDPRNA